MAMTKKEMVKEILSIKKIDSEANLMKLTSKDLEDKLNDLKVEQNTTQPQPVFDMVAFQEQMRQEMLKTLELEREKIREEVKSELVSNKPTVDETVVEKLPETPIYRRQDIDKNRLVPVMNVTNGALVYASKRTGAEYHFTNYGDIEYIEVSELLTMRSSAKAFIDEPHLIILDDEVIEYMGLRKQYNNLSNAQNIDVVFTFTNEEFEEVVNIAPKGIQVLIVSRAKTLYNEGTFDSVQKIRFLNEKFAIEIGTRG